MWIASNKFILSVLILLIIGQAAWDHSSWVQANAAWFDIPLHFLGGVLVAAIFLLFLESRSHLFDLRKNIFVSVLFLASFVMLIGAFWEFYEYLVDYFFRMVLQNEPIKMTLSDTLSDLAVDSLGGLVAAVLYFKKGNKESGIMNQGKIENPIIPNS